MTSSSSLSKSVITNIKSKKNKCIFHFSFFFLLKKCLTQSGLSKEADPFKEVIWHFKRHPQMEEPLGSPGLIRFVLQRSSALSTSNIYGSHIKKTDIWDVCESWVKWILLKPCCSPLQVPALSPTRSHTAQTRTKPKHSPKQALTHILAKMNRKECR